MSDLNKRLAEWNAAIKTGEDLATDMRAHIMRRKDSWLRRFNVKLLRILEKWNERGKRWRNEDIFGGDE